MKTGEAILTIESVHLSRMSAFFMGGKRMKRKSITQVKAISGNSPEETAMLFNETMNELAMLNPKYERDGNVFWVYYTVETREAETLADVYEMKGEGRLCGECPFCMRDTNRHGNVDARKKWATCTRTGEKVFIESGACDEYYRLGK